MPPLKLSATLLDYINLILCWRSWNANDFEYSAGLLETPARGMLPPLCTSGNLDPNSEIHYLLWEPVWRWPRPSKVGMNTYVVCRRNCGMKPAHDRKLLYVTKEGASFKTAAKTCTACGCLLKHNTSYVAQQWEKSHLNTVRFYSRTYTHTQKKKKKKKCTSLVSLTFLTESPAPTRHEKYSQNESLLRSNKT